MAFSPDHSMLAVGGEEGKLHLWDLSARAPKRTAIACGFAICVMAFAPDGHSIWVAGDDPLPSANAHHARLTSNTAITMWPLADSLLDWEVLT